jgi:hypothetical protein
VEILAKRGTNESLSNWIGVFAPFDFSFPPLQYPLRDLPVASASASVNLDAEVTATDAEARRFADSQQRGLAIMAQNGKPLERIVALELGVGVARQRIHRFVGDFLELQRERDLTRERAEPASEQSNGNGKAPGNRMAAGAIPQLSLPGALPSSAADCCAQGAG